MTDYLVFSTEAAANTALETIYANMVGAVNAPDLLNMKTGQVVQKDDLTTDEAVKTSADDRHFPVFGVNAATGIKDYEHGYTTAWAVAQETVSGSWVFVKPDDSLMGDVVDYTVAPYDPAWFPSEVVDYGI
jgi:hypothetical protein